MKKLLFGALAATLCVSASCRAEKSAADGAGADVPTVYHISDITPENLVKIYKALGREAQGKVAVKISTGESSATNYLRPDFIKPLMDEVHGTIVECNTAYDGNRRYTADHLKAIEERGFTAIAPCDIMDADGDVNLPIEGGKHLKYHIVGSHYPNYDFTVVLSHFKGHQMGGFGGALKNISIGIGSSNGKAYIHSAGATENADSTWRRAAEQKDFLESMAEASKAIADHAGEKILYINVANNLSVDCDCNAHPAAPEMNDLGIFASLDPVAVDQACVEAVFNAHDEGKEALIERINSRLGTHTIDHAAELGVGSKKYQLVELK
ncbi:MAG: DUF362 domain-containing protein [Muribaculaceae bacterium]|nr:DUF362 domain-containing protein [Muribaculaceae bacterium]